MSVPGRTSVEKNGGSFLRVFEGVGVCPVVPSTLFCQAVFPEAFREVDIVLVCND